MAKIAADAGADAVSMVSTFRAMAINVETRRPRLSNVTGGLSGPAIKPIALRMVYETAKVVTIPIIGMGGIVTPEDAIEFLMAGATAVEVGTASLVDPRATERLANGLIAWCRDHNVERVSSLTGALDSAITWPTPAPIVFGAELTTDQLNATASVAGTFTYTPDLGDVLTVGNHMLSVTFRPHYAEDYALAQASVLLSVVKATPSITWPEPAPIRYGIRLSTVQLNARASVPGTFAYTPAIGEVLREGSHSLSVTFTPTDADTYVPVQADVSLIVFTATPTITWPEPAPIVCGTELGTAQLNARASVPGTFAYTPDVGDVLPVGSYVLSATFTPSDTENYTIAQADVSITVTKAMLAIKWPEPARIVYGTKLSSVQLNASASAPGTFAYTPALDDVLTVGNHKLSATFMPADAEDYAQAQVSVLLAVIKAMPAIMWPEPEPIVYGTELSAAQLNATSTVPGTFAYAPDASSKLAAGNHVLLVSFTPTDAKNYASAQAEVSLNVTKAKPILTWPEPSPIVYGSELSSMELNATASVPGIFAYTPSFDDALTVGEHMLSVIFTSTDSDNYSSAQVSVLLSVVKATPTISWPELEPIVYGTELGSAHLNATASVPGTFAYTPASGDVRAVGRHTLSVTFTPADTTSYTMAHAEVSIAVTRTMPAITWPEPAPIVYGAELSTEQLNATASVPGIFAYTPGEGDVLTAGNQILSATFTPAHTEDYALAQAEVLLSVVKATPAIMWQKPAPIRYGTQLSTAQLNATCSVPGRFAYTPSIGEVLREGSHTLSVIFTPIDSDNYGSAEFNVWLSVVKATPTIVWPEPAPIVCGTELSTTQLNATASVPGTFAYTPALGDVPPVACRMLSLTFTPTDTENYTMVRADISITVTKPVPAITWPKLAPIRYGIKLNSAQLNATASVPGTFAYTPAFDEVLKAGEHMLSATFTPTDAENYAQAQVSVLLAVVKATPAVTWTEPEPIVYGTKLCVAQLNATASVPGTFTYTPGVGNVLSAGRYVLSAMFTPTDTENYSWAQAEVSLNVLKVTPAITWTKPVPITYGSRLNATQLNAMASVPGTFAYAPAIGTTLTAGKHMLSVTLTPTDTANYTTAQAEVPLSVTKAKPTLTWPSPRAIPHGTALGAAQLNATASARGTFVYSPAAGTMLSVGAQTLSLTFIPFDTENYTTVQASVSLVVEEGPFIASFMRTKADADAEEIAQLLDAFRIDTEDEERRTPVTHAAHWDWQQVPPRNISDYAAIEEVKRKALHSTGHSIQNSEPETRFYKGASYRKGADGQWHLQK